MTDPDLDDVAFLSGVCVCVSPVRSGSSTISFSTRISDQILYFIEPAFPIQYEIWKKKKLFIFAGGDSSAGRQTRNGVAVCSQKRALCVTAIVLAALLGTALVIAYAGPQNGE